MESNVFLDTAYAIALSSRNDFLHNKAIEIANEMQSNQTQMITTRAVMMEIGNALSRQRFRSRSIKLLFSLERDQNVEIVPFSEQLYATAFSLYCDRPDKEWGLIDCISFVVMKEHGLNEALTNDNHFAQAGFIPLMR